LIPTAVPIIPVIKATNARTLPTISIIDRILSLNSNERMRHIAETAEKIQAIVRKARAARMLLHGFPEVGHEKEPHTVAPNPDVHDAHKPYL